ncbi:MAG: hypothetical protein QS748_11280 [Candidatus Endonucleobacter bathymodioli]|uniref:Uncharacterized protein n=1 Tax=Candidatus Endonucleibacter bathymodioli TaxID=539814 RepID=A0AA90NXD6_9GAMM|nr:hypothetical protein [Candidatus Endonucleobacter bathymodioli]
MKNTSSGKSYTFLKGQEESLFFVYRICIFIGILFSDVSFAGIGSVYADAGLRQSSYKSDTHTCPIFTNISHQQFVKAGFFYLGGMFLQCFFCEQVVEADKDMTIADLKTKCHNDSCDYIKNIFYADLCGKVEIISPMGDGAVDAQSPHVLFWGPDTDLLNQSNFVFYNDEAVIFIRRNLEHINKCLDLYTVNNYLKIFLSSAGGVSGVPDAFNGMRQEVMSQLDKSLEHGIKALIFICITTPQAALYLMLLMYQHKTLPEPLVYPYPCFVEVLLKHGIGKQQ